MPDQRDKAEDEKLEQRSHAYEVALIDNNLQNAGNLWLDDIENNSSVSDPVPLVIKIDLGGGKFSNIAALKNSNPLELATRFCQEYSLPEAIIEPLRSRIATNI